MKKTLIKLHWFLSSQMGIDPLLFLNSCKGVIFYFNDLKKFKKIYKGKIKYVPCLNDRKGESGLVRNEYFWQDLIVARLIFQENPKIHVDIGSRVDGFVAHVASFREIQVFDVRPNKSEVPGILFKALDFSDLNQVKSLARSTPNGYCDSVSCLHALEHFGLGRYGDPVEVDGYIKGIKNMSILLSPGGIFYLSIPVGEEKVEFNANWIFNPWTIISCAESNNLQLKKLFRIDNQSGVIEEEITNTNIEQLAQSPYNLTLFIFEKF